MLTSSLTSPTKGKSYGVERQCTFSVPYGPQCGLFNISAGDEEYSELMLGADVFARRKNLV